jgi:hypothetical protein
MKSPNNIKLTQNKGNGKQKFMVAYTFKQIKF